MTVFDVDASEVVPTLELIEEVAVAVFEEEFLMEEVSVSIFERLACCSSISVLMLSMQSSWTKTGIALRIIEKKKFLF